MATKNKQLVDRRLMSLSVKFGIAKYVTLLLLTVFVIGMLASNSDDITVESIKYLMKYLDADATVYSYETDFQTITYSTENNMTFDVYRGDFVVAGSSNISIYATSGRSVMSETSYMSNPVIIPTSKYMMVYDLGGNTYSIYNTFSQVYTDSLDYPITGAAYCDSGEYALITKTEEYRTAVFVYDKNNNLTSKVLKDKNKLVTDCDISSDGEELLIVSAMADEGSFSGEILIYSTIDCTEKHSLEIGGVMPLKVSYCSDGFYIICDSEIRFYDADANFKGRYDYGLKTPVQYCCEDDYAFLVFSDSVMDDRYTIFVFDTSGNRIAKKSFEGHPVDMLYSDGSIYLLTDSRLLRFSMTTTQFSEYKVESNSIGICLASGDTLYLCYSGQASALDITQALSYGDIDYTDEDFYVEAEGEEEETDPFVVLDTEIAASEETDVETDNTQN